MFCINPSGVVPRDILPGIVWDADAEARYVEIAKQKIDAGFRSEYAEREARYAVEFHLHNQYLNREVTKAVKCKTDNEKRAVFREWVSAYGEVRALRLSNVVKSPKLRDAALGYK